MTSAASDSELLRLFAENSSADAFEELVGRHLDHVFSAALRRVNGDHALAKDVTQTVFVDFARKAKRIPADMPPGGWLHRHTGFVASKMIDKERRRRAREQEAANMNSDELNSPADPEWSATAPLLDAAMDTLPESDRNALVLRFFEQRDFRSVGAALGMSDDTAQKKVSRAVEKLRAVLSRRGVTSTGGALAALMLANSVQAAPAKLAAQVSAQSLAGAATAGGSFVDAFLNLTTAARVKVGVAAVALGSAAGIVGSQVLKPDDKVPDPSPKVAVQPAVPDNQNGASSEPDKAPAERTTTTPAAAAMSVEELVDAAATAWGGGNESVSRTAKALGFLIKVPPGQMGEALDFAKKNPNEKVRRLLMKNLLGYWAEVEPKAARKWASNEMAGTHRADMEEALKDLWETDNQAAVQALSGKTASAQFNRERVDESATANVYRAMANEDIARAFARLKDAKIREITPALRGIFDTVKTDADRQKVMPLIEKISADDLRIQARRTMVEGWASWLWKSTATWPPWGTRRIGPGTWPS